MYVCSPEDKCGLCHHTSYSMTFLDYCPVLILSQSVQTDLSHSCSYTLMLCRRVCVCVDMSRAISVCFYFELMFVSLLVLRARIYIFFFLTNKQKKQSSKIMYTHTQASSKYAYA